MDETVARLRAESAEMRARLRTEAGRIAFDEIAGGDTDDWTLFDLIAAIENEAAAPDLREAARDVLAIFMTTPAALAGRHVQALDRLASALGGFARPIGDEDLTKPHPTVYWETSDD